MRILGILACSAIFTRVGVAFVNVFARRVVVFANLIVSVWVARVVIDTLCVNGGTLKSVGWAILELTLKRRVIRIEMEIVRYQRVSIRPISTAFIDTRFQEASNERVTTCDKGVCRVRRHICYSRYVVVPCAHRR